MDLEFWIGAMCARDIEGMPMEMFRRSVGVIVAVGVDGWLAAGNKAYKNNFCFVF